MSKTIYIGGRLESKEKGNVVTGANAILDDTKGKKQNVINKETDDELARLEQSKQDNLTFDNAPTEDSTNPVTSGGVYTAEKALSDAIEAILLLIPSAATALNKLVDTNTMNSSISTATATFRGTYNAVSDLGLTYQATHAQIEAALDALGLTADNNDFAFVQIPVSDQSQDIAKTERFKFNGTNWLYEYDLNTSGFTAAQWAAINSTITLALVQKLAALPTNAELLQALGLKQDVLTFDNAPTTDSNNPVKSGGIKTAIDTAVGDEATARENADTALSGLIGDEKTRAEGVEGGLDTRLGAVEGSVSTIQGVIPSEATSSNKLVDNLSMTTYIGTIIDNIDATFNVTSTDGHVTLAITQVNGVITSVQLTTSDIASAAALNLKASQADLTALAGRVTTAEGNITSLTGRMTTAEGDIDTLTDLYNALQQSAPQVIQPTDTWPVANPSDTVIYRVIDRVNTPPEYYSDYMWNGTSMVLMATYNNAVDAVPTYGSNNLVKSGGVKSSLDNDKQESLSFIFDALNYNIANIKKNTYSIRNGYYREISGAIIDFVSGSHFSLIPISIEGYNIKKVTLRGNVGISVAASNVFITDDSGNILFRGILASDSQMLDVESIVGGKYLYLNFFNIDNADYYFELSFNLGDKKVTMEGVGFLPNNKLYPVLGVKFNTYGFIDQDGVYNNAGGMAWICTDYIPTTEGDIIKFRLYGQRNSAVSGTNIISFYDENYMYIDGLFPEQSGVIESSIKAPSRAKFVRFSCSNESLDDRYVLFDNYAFKQEINKIDSHIHLFDSINKPISFNGKILLAFGDSITDGVSSPNLSPAGANSYINLFASHVGATLNNKAVSGALFTPGYNEVTSIYDTIINTTDACDVILIAGGINDWQKQVPLGVFGNDDTVTLYGVLKKICDYLQSQYTGKDVIFITPIPTTNTTTFGVEHPDNLNLYRKAIQEVAAYYGYNVVNGADLGLPDSMSPFGNVMFASNDCVHPTLAGHALYAKSLAGKLL